MNAPALSAWSLPALRQRWQPRLPGLLLVGLIAAASLYLAGLPWLQAHGLSALTVAIVAGIVVGNTIYRRLAPGSAAGVGFSKHWLLRAGIVSTTVRIVEADLPGHTVAEILAAKGLLKETPALLAAYDAMAERYIDWRGRYGAQFCGQGIGFVAEDPSATHRDTDWTRKDQVVLSASGQPAKTCGIVVPGLTA